MTNWIDIGPLEAIAPRGARVLRTAFGCIAVFRTAEDEVYAIDNTCPHRGGPLAEGIVHGHSVTCPLHNWVFDLRTGEAQGSDSGAVGTYGIRVEAGRLLIDPKHLEKRDAA
ncbi:nitrite reductase small subunit NirD [Sulfitobacter sp. D35]|uniref:nitrite reductase small subunit NirD n=1 Tax=Sulfitobacter sp. D35 TaxID=3083252 RepID=UPI00296FD20D|nr:nitrite reductase small subunit NirD [Sulfitobacter sp. D35]MDW4498912.1 nitrite reductase small subunit NirD [Sulfitobacter sp. D35]